MHVPDRAQFSITAVDAASVSTRALALFLIASMAAMQVLLLAFLGQPPVVLALGSLASAGLVLAIGRQKGWSDRPAISVRDLAIAIAIALILLALGGEGRLFFANTDWQVRNVVLRDVVLEPWPFAYDGVEGIKLLRCPIGMYLLPGLVGKLAGVRGAEFAMLAQNAVLLGCVFALVAGFYRTGKERLATLALFLGFSGLDILGQMLVGKPLIAHAEYWSGFQYTAPMTLIFWVPQHMLAGLIGAALFLQVRAGRAPLCAFLAFCPLAALLSPLAIVGLLPLAGYLGIQALARRQLRLSDIALPGLATALAVPSLVYLSAGSGSIGGGSSELLTPLHVAFYVLEVFPFLTILWLARGHWRFDRVTVAILVACLLLFPVPRIGVSADFMMRASIPQIAILALLMADIILKRADDATAPPRLHAAKALAIGVFTIGLAVPLGEIARAIALPPAPAAQCSFIELVPTGFPHYVAPIESIPAVLRPGDPKLVSPGATRLCWDGPWPDATRDWRGEQRPLFGGAATDARSLVPRHAPGAPPPIAGMSE